MEWLNYHHLYYFWTVARSGSITAASRKLRLAQPTVSTQIRALEHALDVQLFHRRGGRMVLTETGKHVFRYADQIFELGQELQHSLSGHKERHGTRLVVGICDALPKLVAHHLLEPALLSDPTLRVTCYEDRHERLLAQLALCELDVVLSDVPIESHANVRGFSHLLFECGVTLLAPRTMAARLRENFPASLDGCDVLLPIEQTSLRSELERWFEVQDVRPHVRGEIQDSALISVLSQTGEGFFAVPSVIEDELVKQLDLGVVSRLDDLRERFYALTLDQQLTHPGVVAITEAARGLFEH
jgi:LysR family transcriptional activator of nhaA